MACDHCAELEARVKSLEGELAINVARSRVAELCRLFRFAPQVGMIVAALYDVNGRVLSRDQLDHRLGDPAKTDMRSFKHIEVLIHRARDALGAQAIETHWNLGYRLTDLGRLVVEEALEGRRRLVA